MIFVNESLANLGVFLEGGDFRNPSEQSERALRASGLTGECNLARRRAQNDIEIT